MYAPIGALDEDFCEAIAIHVRDCGHRQSAWALPLPQNVAGRAIACDGDEFVTGSIKQFVAFVPIDIGCDDAGRGGRRGRQ